MTRKIVFATNNQHKLDEIRKITEGKIEILSLNDIGSHDEIEETGSTLEENALIKARFIKNKCGYDCFAEDTGLEVEALGNAPGVYSARYAGDACRDEEMCIRDSFNCGNCSGRCYLLLRTHTGNRNFIKYGSFCFMHSDI